MDANLCVSQRFKWGFLGAPTAVAITQNLLPLCLWLYVYFVDGMQCWNGFTRQALRNWAPMVRLAVPGFVMVISEFLAFEVLTLASSHISNTALAAQSVLATLSIVTFQIPFPISVAASTRLANHIGAGRPGASRVCIHVTLAMACGAGAFNMLMLTTLRHYIPKIFTSDPAVSNLIVRVIPLFAAFQLFDALVANCSGVLRGMGRQKIGGWVNVICYYGVSVWKDHSSWQFLTQITDRNTCLLWGGFWLTMGLVWIVDGASRWTLPVSAIRFVFALGKCETSFLRVDTFV
jgi:multidrug resistance protein, MATE family